MYKHSIRTQLLFALASGLAAVAWLVATQRYLGLPWAASLFAPCASIAYLVLIAPTGASRLRSAAIATALVVVTGGFFLHPFGLLLGAIVSISVVRSGFIARQSPARSLLLETGFITVGLAIANFSAAMTPLGFGLAICQFFLVQSVFFLCYRPTTTSADRSGDDAFETAAARIDELLNQRI